MHGLSSYQTESADDLFYQVNKSKWFHLLNPLYIGQKFLLVNLRHLLLESKQMFFIMKMCTFMWKYFLTNVNVLQFLSK